MTFKQLEQFLRTEKWRAGTQQNSDMCGKYARCAYCDRFSDFPCARAYDTLMRKKREGKASVSFWQFPEPDVKEKFGTVYASEDADGVVTRISIDPEDLFYFSLGGRNVEMYSQPYYGKEAGESEPRYPQTVYASLPDGSGESEFAGDRYFSERTGGGAVSLNADENGTRVLVIRKRAKTRRL